MSFKTAITRIRVAPTLVLLVLLPQMVMAQDPAESAVSVDVSVDVASQYFFRGFLQEDGGSIIQPGAEVGVSLIETGSTSLSASLGMWGSFHSRQTGTTTNDAFVADWYEADFYGGLALDISDWAVGAQFITYAYPNGAASSIDEMTLSLGYDDASLWHGMFALNPYVLYAVEVTDRGGTEDSYFEVGVAPSHSFDVSEKSTLSIEIPLAVGFSVKDYYVSAAGEEDGVGFWDLGLNASLGIPVPTRFGGWSINAGAHYLSLGTAASELNNGDESAVVGSVGLGWSF